MARQKLTMDGNTAAGHVSYAFTEVAAIYPITPSSVMAEVTDQWATAGRKIFWTEVRVVEMQSEPGCRCCSRFFDSWCFDNNIYSFTGTLLMVPNMYKIAGELLSSVIHVSARAVANHALSILVTIVTFMLVVRLVMLCYVQQIRRK